MTPDTIDAIKILESAWRSLGVESEWAATLERRNETLVARHVLYRSIQYLAKPDRFMRSKRGSSIVKSRNPKP
jgi:hypothetical protein